VQLKTIQESDHASRVFRFSCGIWAMSEWNYFVGFGLMVMAVWVIFKKW